MPRLLLFWLLGDDCGSDLSHWHTRASRLLGLLFVIQLQWQLHRKRTWFFLLFQRIQKEEPVLKWRTMLPLGTIRSWQSARRVIFEPKSCSVQTWLARSSYSVFRFWPPRWRKGWKGSHRIISNRSFLTAQGDDQNDESTTTGAEIRDLDLASNCYATDAWCDTKNNEEKQMRMKNQKKDY